MNIKDVENLAELAKIELSGIEKKALSKDLDNILGYVKQIEEVPTSVGIPTEVGIENYNVWREDEIKPSEFSKELLTEQFPDSQDGFLKVKKIL